MANNKFYLKRSSQKDKAPDDLEYGELAINFNTDSTALYAKVTNGTVSEDKIVNLLSVDSTVAALTDGLTDHMNNTNNPHGVTKAQVGLGNVDNTSDLNKPISTAAQTELDKKLSKTDVYNALDSIDTTKALSAAQGKVLDEKLENAQAGAGTETQKVLEELNTLGTRVSGIEEEVNGAVTQADSIISRMNTMTNSSDTANYLG